MANIEGIKMARHESLSRVLMPRNFTHSSTIMSALPEKMDETALEKEIKRIVELQSATIDNSLEQRRMTVGGYESMKFRLSPRHARLSNHGGHEYVSSLIDKNLNIMSRLETQITNDEDKRKKTQAKENTFGLGAKYIATRK